MKRFWAWPWELKRRGVLGINARNLGYVAPLNPRARYPMVDDKALTKQLCRERGIPVPETYGLLEEFGHVAAFLDTVSRHARFVVKPARGAGGRGVLVVTSHNGDGFETAGGGHLDRAQMRYHLCTTMSGLYSLGGRPDRVIVEQLIDRHPVFDCLAVGGTPDVRVIVYRGQAVMAMLRLPTRQSRGKANLHQGAIGAGIDMATGTTLEGVWNDRIVDRHPDTNQPIAGVRLPHWQRILEVASCLAESLGLGYIGVDIVLDAVAGPVVLEANARPGLAIQLANRTGLTGCLTAPDHAPPPP